MCIVEVSAAHHVSRTYTALHFGRANVGRELAGGTGITCQSWDARSLALRNGTVIKPAPCR